MTNANDSAARFENIDDKSIRDLRIEYYAECRELAQACVDEAKRDGRDVSDVVHEACDGHNWVIYTYKAQIIALISQHSDAWQELGDERPDETGIAYWAMRMDVEECIAELPEADRDEWVGA